MPRRNIKDYNQMVDPIGERYDDVHTIDGEAAPVVQRRGSRWPLVVGVILVLALVAVAIVNRGTLAAPDIMQYSEDRDAYQTDALVIRQRGMYHIKASMNCEDVQMTTFFATSVEDEMISRVLRGEGVSFSAIVRPQSSECVQERQ